MLEAGHNHRRPHRTVDPKWRHAFAVTAFGLPHANHPLWFGHLKDGFAVYNPDQQPQNLKDKEVTDSAIAALDAAPGGPWFSFVHYLGPHDPYPDR